jgi:Catalytic LigB subunit of aromatic ring-opening dioxygenase
MGKLVLGMAAPHNPNITARPDSMTDGEKQRVFGAFTRLRKELETASPDCLLVLTTDHMTNFFYHNNPLFCLGIADTCEGPAPKELPRLGVAPATLKVDTVMAKGLLQYGIENDIDFSYSEEMTLDHAYMVPLHFITPKMDLPIVPLHIGSLLPPCPTARRCYKIGKQIREFVERQYPGKVAVLASGSLFSDVGGPTMGWVDTPFDMAFLDLVKEGKSDEFAQRVTPETLKKGGVATELLAWVALLGALGNVKASFVDYVWAQKWGSGAGSFATWHPAKL